MKANECGSQCANYKVGANIRWGSLEMALNDSWILENADVRTFPSKPTLLYTIQLYAVPRRLFNDPKTRDPE